MKWEEIQERGLDLRRRSRERMLAASGVEVEAVTEAEQEIERDFDSLIEEIRGGLVETGGDVAEAHSRSLDRANLLLEQRAERALIDLEALKPVGIQCNCWWYWPADYEKNDYEPLVGNGTGSVSYDPPEVAHPLVEATSPGTGALRTAKITPWWMFSFTPSNDRMYCIRPQVQMSGHWLLWTWGTCAGTTVGNGKVSVKVTTQVDQLSAKIASREVMVLDESVTSGADKQSGFAYDSETDDGLEMTALLSGGDQAVIWVKCELYAEIANHGRAWVDMQTSPAFYCKVPSVKRGLVFCWPYYRAF